MPPTFDVIVVGLGGMGSAAAHHLAARGARVLGLEKFGPVHNKGSSHGGSRITRQSYFEDPAYVPLLLRALRAAGSRHRPQRRHPLRRRHGRPPRIPHRRGLAALRPAVGPAARNARRGRNPPPLPHPQPPRRRGRPLRGTGRPRPPREHRRRPRPARHPGRRRPALRRAHDPLGGPRRRPRGSRAHGGEHLHGRAPRHLPRRVGAATAHRHRGAVHHRTAGHVLVPAPRRRPPLPPRESPHLHLGGRGRGAGLRLSVDRRPVARRQGGLLPQGHALHPGDHRADGVRRRGGGHGAADGPAHPRPARRLPQGGDLYVLQHPRRALRDLPAPGAPRCRHRRLRILRARLQVRTRRRRDRRRPRDQRHDRHFYTDPGVFRLEPERIFESLWYCAVRSADLERPGAYRTVQAGRESVLITRTRTGELRAFLNVCRHRGARLCTESAGEVRRNLQCPYHAWTYGLDGTLVAAPNLQKMPDIDRTEYGLVKVALREWLGYAWICLADTVSIERYETEGLTLGRRISYDVAANWKLIVENFMECYHCATIHPELTDEQDRRYYAVTIRPQVFVNLVPDHVIVHRMFPLAEDRTVVECDWLYAPGVVASGADLDKSVELFHRVNTQDFDACERTQPAMASGVPQGRGPGAGGASHRGVPRVGDGRTAYQPVRQRNP